MNLYYLTQNKETGYDTFDACIVAAETEDAARRIHPWTDFYKTTPIEVDGEGYFQSCRIDGRRTQGPRCWCPNIADVTVALLGTAVEETREGVILGSFNGG